MIHPGAPSLPSVVWHVLQSPDSAGVVHPPLCVADRHLRGVRQARLLVIGYNASVPLVVDVSLPAAPAATDARARAVLLEACGEALPEQGTCAVGASAATVMASVVWLDENTTQARISVRVGEVVRARTLRFSPRDPPDERLRSIGFAIATLVPPAAARALAAPEAPTVASWSASSALTTPLRSPPVSVSVPAFVAVPATAAPVVDRVVVGLAAGLWTAAAGKPFPGAEARIGFALGSIEPTLAAGATIEREEGPKIDTALLWSSIGLRLPLWSSSRGRALLRAEALGEQVHVELYTLEGVHHRFRWIPGARFGVDAEIPAFGRAFITTALGTAVRGRDAAPAPMDQPAVSLGRVRAEASAGIGTRF